MIEGTTASQAGPSSTRSTRASTRRPSPSSSNMARKARSRTPRWRPSSARRWHFLAATPRDRCRDRRPGGERLGASTTRPCSPKVPLMRSHLPATSGRRSSSLHVGHDRQSERRRLSPPRRPPGGCRQNHRLGDAAFPVYLWPLPMFTQWVCSLGPSACRPGRTLPAPSQPRGHSRGHCRAPRHALLRGADRHGHDRHAPEPPAPVRPRSRMMKAAAPRPRPCSRRGAARHSRDSHTA